MFRTFDRVSAAYVSQPVTSALGISSLLNVFEEISLRSLPQDNWSKNLAESVLNACRGRSHG